MLVFRSFALGLLAACFVVLAYRPSVQIFMPRPPPAPPSHASAPVVLDHPGPGASIIDVAPEFPRSHFASLVPLAPGERIVADPGAIEGALDALAAGPANGHYIDLSVVGQRGTRRVLVLFH